ncbi:hypothetical protein BG003_008301 [Podila horticola]|nr:hypothetical protein BG003_008301 [Podila horticola]
MGLQFTWSVEMAYGTPFLLQLGLSKSLMSLVWLAGPLSAFGDTQVKGLCIIACLFLVLAVGTTCVAVTEQFLVRPPKYESI